MTRRVSNKTINTLTKITPIEASEVAGQNKIMCVNQHLCSGMPTSLPSRFYLPSARLEYSRGNPSLPSKSHHVTCKKL